MKKIYLLLGIIPALAMIFGINNASAQRKNNTSKDVPADVVEVVEIDEELIAVPNCPCMGKKGCNCNNKMKNKKMMKAEKMHKKQLEDINEEYQEAVEKINGSSFTTDQKNMLKNQAMENKNLAEKQLQERHEMMKKHHKTNANLMHNAHGNKANKKALKEIHDILD